MRRIALDTNVLVYAHIAAFPEHGAVRRWLETALRDNDVTVVLTPLVLHELIHIITDPRRFDAALSMDEACALSELYLGRSNTECLSLDEATMAFALELIRKHRLGRKRVADTLLAATLGVHQVRELATCNGSDFSSFDFLSTLDPSKV